MIGLAPNSQHMDSDGVAPLSPKPIPWTWSHSQSLGAATVTGVPGLVNGFIFDIASLEFKLWPGMTLLRCKFDVSAFRDELYGQLCITCPENIRSAVPKRKAEFLAARYLSRILLETRGLPTNLPSGHHRQPLWPTGWVGSITHTHDTAVSVLAASWQGSLLGIDLERWMDPEIADKIKRTIVDNREECLLAGPWPFAHALTLAFSAKESLFKAIYPMVGCYFDFDCVELVELDYASGTFVFRIARVLSPRVGIGEVFQGHFDILDNGVLTVVHRQNY